MLLCLHNVIVAIVASPLSKTDLVRARTKVPMDHVQGFWTEDSARKMNIMHTKNLPGGINATACETWDIQSLIEVLERLFEVREPQLEAIYRETADNRRLSASGVHSNRIETLRAEWALEGELVAANPSLAPISRNSRCYDAVMWWVHHVPQSTKKELAGSLPQLPLLPIDTPLPQDADPHAIHKLLRSHSSRKAVCHQAQCFTGSPWPQCKNQTARKHPPTLRNKSDPPIPKPWPKAFSSPFLSPPYAKNTTGNYSLVDGLASRIDFQDGYRDRLCSSMYNHTPCTQLTVSGFRYLDFPELGKCCKCCAYGSGSYPCAGPIAGDYFLTNTTGDLVYVGQAKYRNLTCDGWNHWGVAPWGNYYWSLAEEGDPRFGMPIVIDNANYLATEHQRADDMYVFDPDVFTTSVDNLLFEVPTRCRESPYCGTHVCAPGPKQQADQYYV